MEDDDKHEFKPLSRVPGCLIMLRRDQRAEPETHRDLNVVLPIQLLSSRASEKRLCWPWSPAPSPRVKTEWTECELWNLHTSSLSKQGLWLVR